MNWRPSVKIVRVSTRSFLTGVVLLAFLAGAAVGFGMKKLIDAREQEKVSEWRQKGEFRFINPLLECDMASELLGSPELINLRQAVDEYLAEVGRQGTVVLASVYFRRLNDGPWMGINERRLFRGASLLKVPLAMACLRKAEASPELLRKTLVYEGKEDLNVGQTYRPKDPLVRGRAYTVGDLVRRLVQDSDNNAGILLKQVVSDEDYWRLHQEIFPRRPGFPSDNISVRDYSAAFRILYNASFLGKASSEMLLSMMSQSSFSDGIVAGVPPEVAVANKFGESFVDHADGTMAEFHEFGIIYHPRQPYLLGIMLMGPDQERMPAILRDLSALIFREVDSRQ